MELIEALLTRRSVRNFNSSPVEDSKIKKMLETAMHAPSAGRQLAWEFVVMTAREKLAKIGDFHPGGSMAKEAPLGIVVCGNSNKETHKGTWPLDCAAAMQNILLTAHSLELGGVWVGIYPKEERIKALSQILNLPSHIIPLGIAIIGYPVGIVKSDYRYDETLIHYNTWRH